MQLKVNLNTAFCTSLLESREQICNVIPRVAVQTGAQSLLVEVVRNETDAAAKHEQAVEDAHLHVVLNFLAREGTAVAQHVNEADGNATVDVQNEVVLLRRRHCLNGNSIVEQLGAGEVLLGELLDQLDTKVRVVPGLDTVSDTGNCTR